VKVCSKCKHNFPLTEFYKDKSHLDGHADRCKYCDYAICKQYRLKHKLELSNRSTVWNRNNPEKRRRVNRKYYLKRLTLGAQPMKTAIDKGE
jgi:hypothetical protein